jgi:transposase-like protein
MDFFSFCELISNKNKLISYFQDKNVISRNNICSRCNISMSLQDSSRAVDGVQFRCVRCKSTKSVRNGSFLGKSKLPLKVFAAILFFHHCEILQKHIAELLGISLPTLVDWSNFIRERCSLMLLGEEKLGGDGIRVQVDESVLSYPKLTRNNHARPVVEKWVFGAYDTVQKIGIIKRISNRSRDTLVDVIRNNCKPGSIIVSDGWSGYSNLESFGFRHETVIHEHFFVDPCTGVHTNSVENYWQRCKRRFKRMYGTSDSLLDSHIDEFMWLERYGKTLNERWINWFKTLNFI